MVVLERKRRASLMCILGWLGRYKQSVGALPGQSDSKNKFASCALVLMGVLFPLVIIASLAIGQETLPTLVKKIQPSVVSIFTYNDAGKLVNQGSGFFISQSGELITNRHVLEGASRAEVKTATGTIHPISIVIAEDEKTDIIRVSGDFPGSDTKPLTLGRNFPDVGERVLVIGSPLGLEQSVSEGIVSAVRDMPRFGKIIQITAPISPGSSGSPVVNREVK